MESKGVGGVVAEDGFEVSVGLVELAGGDGVDGALEEVSGRVVGGG
jgi:hypothetical protein